MTRKELETSTNILTLPKLDAPPRPQDTDQFLAHKETELEKQMNGAWDSEDEKEMNALAKDTLKRQSAITDAEVKSQLLKVTDAQAAPATDKSALQLSIQESNLELNDIQNQETPEKDLSLENPLPNPLLKPLTKTNQDNTHDIFDPFQRITYRSGNYFN